jgi:hypothetical protein
VECGVGGYGLWGLKCEDGERTAMAMQESQRDRVVRYPKQGEQSNGEATAGSRGRTVMGAGR